MNLNPLTQLNAITIVSIIVIFTMTYFALKRLYVDKYVDFMEARALEVSEGRAAGLEAEAIIVKAKAEAEEILRCARTEADDIAAQTRADSYDLREQRRFTAMDEAEKIVAKGRGSLTDMKNKERALLESELVTTVWRIVSKLDGAIDRCIVEDVVRRNMDGADEEADFING
jgi:F0F1-type ATP synthase membrane subunit b/b'